MIRQYLIINCDLAISRKDFVNKTAAAVGFRIIRFLPYLVCGIDSVTPGGENNLLSAIFFRILYVTHRKMINFQTCNFL